MYQATALRALVSDRETTAAKNVRPNARQSTGEGGKDLASSNVQEAVQK